MQVDDYDGLMMIVMLMVKMVMMMVMMMMVMMMMVMLAMMLMLVMMVMAMMMSMVISKLPHAGRLKDTAFDDHLKVCPHAGDFVVVAGDGQETEIVRESLRRKSRLPQVRHNRRGGLSTISIEINKKN